MLYILFLQEMAKESTECAPEVMNAEDLLFMLYTSGSTGQPKGLSHVHGGYLLYAAMTHRVGNIIYPRIYRSA